MTHTQFVIQTVAKHAKRLSCEDGKCTLQLFYTSSDILIDLLSPIAVGWELAYANDRPMYIQIQVTKRIYNRIWKEINKR